MGGGKTTCWHDVMAKRLMDGCDVPDGCCEPLPSGAGGPIGSVQLAQGLPLFLIASLRGVNNRGVGVTPREGRDRFPGNLMHRMQAPLPPKSI